MPRREPKEAPPPGNTRLPAERVRPPPHLELLRSLSSFYLSLYLFGLCKCVWGGAFRCVSAGRDGKWEEKREERVNCGKLRKSRGDSCEKKKIKREKKKKKKEKRKREKKRKKI